MELTEIIGQAPAQENERFVVETPENALWCTGKIRQAEERIQQLAAMKAHFIDQIEEWFDRETAEPMRTVDAMRDLLFPYVQNEVAAGKKKSVSFPDGTKAGFRKSPDSVEIADEDKLLEWAEKNAPELVKVKKSVSKTAVKKLMTETGEVPPTVSIRSGEQRFYVDVTND